jgi:hypothetical protein
MFKLCVIFSRYSYEWSGIGPIYSNTDVWELLKKKNGCEDNCPQLKFRLNDMIVIFDKDSISRYKDVKSLIDANSSKEYIFFFHDEEKNKRILSQIEEKLNHQCYFFSGDHAKIHELNRSAFSVFLYKFLENPFSLKQDDFIFPEIMARNLLLPFSVIHLLLQAFCGISTIQENGKIKFLKFGSRQANKDKCLQKIYSNKMRSAMDTGEISKCIRPENDEKMSKLLNLFPNSDAFSFEHNEMSDFYKQLYSFIMNSGENNVSQTLSKIMRKVQSKELEQLKKAFEKKGDGTSEVFFNLNFSQSKKPLSITYDSFVSCLRELIEILRDSGNNKNNPQKIIKWGIENAMIIIAGINETARLLKNIINVQEVMNENQCIDH